MFILLSPAKTLDFDTPVPTNLSTKPIFVKQSQQLAALMSTKSPSELRKLMSISENLAEQVHRYFAKWTKKYDSQRAKQALHAFRGDVYRGFDADTLDAPTLQYAQQHVGILSGLYGLLRPCDLIQPYRLEMGTKLASKHGQNLYHFWGETIADQVHRQLEELEELHSEEPLVVNLASNEYFRAVRHKSLKARIVTPVFKQLHKGEYKVISFLAKHSRGVMARYLCEKQVQTVANLRKFRREGYRFNSELSTKDQPVFTRDQP